MSFPAGFSTGTLTGTFLDLLGRPRAGKQIGISLSPSAVIDAGTNIIIPGDVQTITLDAAGSFSAQLPLGGNPSGYTYHIIELFGTEREYDVKIMPGTQDLADLIPIPASNGAAITVTPAMLATKAVIADIGVAGTPTGDALRAAYVAPSIAFRDTFTGKTPGALGAADTGQSWTTTGANPPVLTAAGMTLPGDGTGAGYAWTDLGAPTGLIAASVTFGAGTTGSVATLLVSKGPGLDLNNLALHYYFDTQGWTMQVRVGGETPFPVLGSGSFSAPLVQDGATEYQALLSVRGKTLRIVHADGSTSAFTDPRIAANLSGVVGCEVFRTDPAQALPVFTRVWAAPLVVAPPQLPYASVDDVARVGQGVVAALAAKDAAQHTQALTIAGDGSIDMGGYRTALVNSSATALTTIRSTLPVGQSISVRPWGGSVTFTPVTGNLSFEGGTFTSGWAQTLTFTRFDFPSDQWVLVSRTG
jgi:hypothetical protein